MSTVPEEQREAVQEMQAKTQACWLKHQALIMQVAPFVVDRFKAQDSGFDLRDWFLDRYGRLVWNQLRDDSGPAVLTTLTGLHPQLKLVLSPPEAVLQYFQQFFTEPGQEPEGTYHDDEENGDDDAA